MATELATAYVSILPTTRGLGKSLSKQFGQADTMAAKAGQSSGSRFTAAFRNVAKKVAVGGFLAVGAAAGAAIIGGVKAAVERQTAEKVLTGLYGSAKKAGKMMTDLREISKNSPLDYSAYQKAAQSLAYAGIEGDSATGILKNVGKAIVAAGGDSSKLDQAMGGVMKAVNNGGIAMMDSLSMISESGVPILSGLADKFGVTTDQVKKMASQGQISIGDVMEVMENGTGKTFQQMIKAGDEASKSFGNQWKIAKDNIVNAIGDRILPLIDKITPAIGPATDALIGLIDGIGKVMSSFSTWGPILATVVGGMVAYQLTMKAITLGTIAWNAITTVAKFATAGWAVQQRILNAALRANPIGIVITALTILVAVFILAYKKVGWFRDMVNAAWAGIKVAVRAVVDWFVNVAWPALKVAWDAVATAAVWLWQNVMLPVWNGIKFAIGAVITWFQTTVAPIISATITVLGTIFTWLYEHIIKPVWTGIQIYIQVWWTVVKAIFTAVVWFVQTVLAPIFTFLKNAIMVAFTIIKVLIQVWWAVVKLIFAAVVAFVKTVLAPVFTWLYNNIVKPVFNWIKTYIQLWWMGVKIIFNALVSFFKNVLGPVFKWLYNNIVKPVFSWIKSVISTWWGGVKAIFNAVISFIKDRLGPAFTWMKNTASNAWNHLLGALKMVWTKIRVNVFTPLQKFVKVTLPNAFEAGKNAIGKAWDKLRGITKKPVQFIIGTVYNNGIRSVWNKVAKTFGQKQLPELKVKGFRRGGDPWEGSGRVRGPGSGTSDSIPAYVSRGEFIVNAKAARRNLPLLHAINGRRGAGFKNGLPAFKGGGMVWNNLWAIVKKQFPSVALHSAYRPGAITSSGNRSFHSMGKAIDITPSMKIFNWLHDHYGQSSELIFSPANGRQIKNGRHYMYRGAVRAQHFNHIHWANRSAFSGETAGAGGGAAGGGFDLGSFLAPFNKLKEKIKGKFAAHPWAQAGLGMAKKIIEAPISWIKDKGSQFVSNIKDGAISIAGGVNEKTAQAQVRTVAAKYGWAAGKQWEAIKELVQRESSWNPSAANPRSSARGLFQKMTSIHGAVEKTAAGQAGWGLKYIKGRYGTPVKALAFHRAHNYYRHGGEVLPRLYDRGGALPPGVSLVANKTRKPEYILPAHITEQLVDCGGGGRSMLAENITVQAVDVSESFRVLERERRKREALAVF